MYGKEEGSVGSQGFVCGGCADDSDHEDADQEEDNICPECGSIIDGSGRHAVCHECGYHPNGNSNDHKQN
jgi:DNA-directed RNA polymerase subunit RPC12/RpoP